MAPNDTQSLLERAYLNPELFSFEINGFHVYLKQENINAIHIGDLNANIPSVALQLLKIRSWHLDRNEKGLLSLRLNLII